MAKKTYTETDLFQRIRARCAPPAWATFRQVANSTGWAGNRYADAIAMSLYPSRGLNFHGFEIKVHRNDWLKELKDPQKAEDMARHCDFWWIVAPKEVVKLEEVPEKWGWLAPHGKGLRQQKKAKRLDEVEVDRAFVAAVLRRAAEGHKEELNGMIPYDSVRDKINEARDHGTELGKRLAGGRSLEYMKEKIEAFEKETGIDIDDYGTWEMGKVGKALKLIMETKSVDNAIHRVKLQLDRVDDAVSDVRKILENTENG